jgi:lipopolysaccharide transport protein LptA
MAQRAKMMVWAALFLSCGLPGAYPPGFSKGDTVSIRADQAWEDEQPDIVHFTGNFLMKAADWSVSADSATLYGNLDDPETVLLEGSPAQVLLLRQTDDGNEEISGTAPQIEYQRKANVIKLSGGAVLRLDDNILRSEEIEYDIELDRYQAGGSEGVRIEVTPRD